MTTVFIDLELFDASKAGVLVAEASTLGLQGWPSTLVTGGTFYTRAKVNRDDDNDITEVVYRATNGRQLVIFND